MDGAAVLWTTCTHHAHHVVDLTWTGACVILVSATIGFVMGTWYRPHRSPPTWRDD